MVHETVIGPQEFRIGFQVFSVTSCTMSGVVMMSQLNGNYALAVLLAVVNKLISVFTMSPLLSLFAFFNSTASLNIGSILLK